MGGAGWAHFEGNEGTSTGSSSLGENPLHEQCPFSCWLLKTPASASGIQAVCPIQALSHSPLPYQTVLLDKILFKITPGQCIYPLSPWKSGTLPITAQLAPKAALFNFCSAPSCWNPRRHTQRQACGLFDVPLTYLDLIKVFPPFLADGVVKRYKQLRDNYSWEKVPSSNYFISLPGLRSYSLMAGCWQKSFHNFLARLHILWQPDLEYWILGLYSSNSGLWVSTKRDQKVPFEYPTILGCLQFIHHLLHFPFFILWLFCHQPKIFKPFPKIYLKGLFRTHSVSTHKLRRALFKELLGLL